MIDGLAAVGDAPGSACIPKQAENSFIADLRGRRLDESLHTGKSPDTLDGDLTAP